MVELISDSNWAAFRQAINSASQTFNKQVITWHKHNKKLSYDGNENNPIGYTDVTLLGLIQYNVYKLWPNGKESESGEVDKTSMALILNKDYLAELGYTNSNGYFSYSPEFDYFTVEGIDYYPSGETPAAQSETDPLLVYVILKRTPLKTGNYPYYAQ